MPCRKHAQCSAKFLRCRYQAKDFLSTGVAIRWMWLRIQLGVSLRMEQNLPIGSTLGHAMGKSRQCAPDAPRDTSLQQVRQAIFLVLFAAANMQSVTFTSPNAVRLHASLISSLAVSSGILAVWIGVLEGTRCF